MVTDGFGCMLVTSVGMNTVWGEKMSSRNCGLNGETKLQAYLIMKLIQCIVTVGLVVAALVLAFSLIWYFTGNTVDDGGNRDLMADEL
jgi:Ca2+-transporting ATPase